MEKEPGVFKGSFHAKGKNPPDRRKIRLLQPHAKSRTDPLYHSCHRLAAPLLPAFDLERFLPQRMTSVTKGGALKCAAVLLGRDKDDKLERRKRGSRSGNAVRSSFEREQSCRSSVYSPACFRNSKLAPQSGTGATPTRQRTLIQRIPSCRSAVRRISCLPHEAVKLTTRDLRKEQKHETLKNI